MKRSRKVRCVALLLFLATISGFGDLFVSQADFLFQGLAIAANENNGEKDPFARKSATVPDPLESLNRTLFQLNDRLYFYFWKPLATIYSWYVPCGVRECIERVFDNAEMPVRVVNNMLQCKPDHAGSEIGRFIINSTLGMGGFFDIAHTHFKMKEYDEDFGQTLATWGMGHRFHIHWPVLGPSSLRDSIGLAFDACLNPALYLLDVPVSSGIRGGEGLNTTSLKIGEYEDFKKSALDPYVSMRDAYFQHRDEEISR